jgi:hypothetical protein
MVGNTNMTYAQSDDSEWMVDFNSNCYTYMQLRR